jgi:hypothetical protein
MAITSKTPADSRRSALGNLIWLPPDLLQTWGERVLAVVALVLIGWLLFDILTPGL